MTTVRLPRAARLLIAGNALSALGVGLVLPLTLIYLHQVRGIALPVVGVLLAGSGSAGLVSVPLSGVAIDRFGARAVLTVVLCGQALGDAGLAWAHDLPTAVPALALLGASMGPSFPAAITLQAGITPAPVAQQRAFAVNFTSINAAIGAGSAVGAAVADVSAPATFQALFLANAATCLMFAALLTRLPNIRPGREEGGEKPGYREVLASRGLRTLLGASLVLAFTGYAAMDSGLPAYATVEAHVGVRVVALSLTANTAVIVIAQLFVLRLVSALRRSRALAAIGVIWAVSWAMLGASGLPLAPGLRIACVFAYTALFGLGETVMAPTVPPLINSLAGERIRGRANALSSAAYSVAFVVSPTISTGLIAAGLPGAWIALLCAGCLVTVALGARLGRRLNPDQDRVGAAPPAAAEPAPA